MRPSLAAIGEAPGFGGGVLPALDLPAATTTFQPAEFFGQRDGDWPVLGGPALDLTAVAQAVPVLEVAPPPTAALAAPEPETVSTAVATVAPEDEVAAAAALTPRAAHTVRRIVIDPPALHAALMDLHAADAAPAPPQEIPEQLPPLPERRTQGRRSRVRGWLVFAAVLAACVVTIAVLESARRESQAGGLTSVSAGYIANGIEISPGDVPAFSAQPQGAGTGAGAGVDACLNLIAALTSTTEVDSPTFVNGSSSGMLEVSSSVIFLPSAAAAQNVIGEAASGRLQSCLTQALSSGANGGAPLATQGSTFGTPLRGADAAVALSTQTAVGSGQPPLNSESRIYAVGRELLVLTTTGSGETFPAAESRALAIKLVSRARSQPH